MAQRTGLFACPIAAALPRRLGGEDRHGERGGAADAKTAAPTAAAPFTPSP